MFKQIFPIFQWLPNYQLSWLKADLVAGLTLAAYAIPVALAYGSLAGLPSEVGLYCYMLGAIGYAFFGTSRQLAVGPTSAISILVGVSLAPLANGDAERYLILASSTAVLVAIICLLAWLLKLSQIVNFISEPILNGFKAGAALQIASTQLPKLFGVPSGGSNFFSRIWDLLHHWQEIQPATLLVGSLALVLLVVGDRLWPSQPISLLVVILAIVAMGITNLPEQGVKVVGEIPQGLPSFGMPYWSFSDLDSLLPLALACFLLSYIEGISTARSFAIKHNYRINPEQELLAIGAANLVAGLGQGYPIAGGLSQSAVNEKAGAKTPLAIIITACVIAIVLLFFTGLFRNLPEAILGAVVLVAVKGLINIAELRHLKKVAPLEFKVSLIALFGVLCFGVLQGVLLAAIASILFLIYIISHPSNAILGRIPGSDQFSDIERHPENLIIPGVLIYRVNGPMLYFNINTIESDFFTQLSQQQEPVELVIFEMGTCSGVDTPAARWFKILSQRLNQQGMTLKLVNASGRVRDRLRAEDLESLVGNFRRLDTINSLIAEFSSQKHSDLP
ncbi:MULTISPECIES: SulP family inorganic anion transporter [unclassified Synechocystis]|uniref:SulP family inorganic anion transporter n=1 Tax=unclassified Synechocystis TaxID=2640012 RepID=UPI000426FB51|nr:MULTISPECIES: SulP family inorganic anion transporter [unclassified Synechocystis]AIE74922.1 sulfate transporter [Synechocystis sp. PCC 6714]MCT0253364.1 SulP family inorganic anion transporter [Synechocystis sp. CS-94]